ncbi:MAG: hypothetical protein QXU98_09475 [Candidatus Parvarchaeota archaeon]
MGWLPPQPNKNMAKAAKHDLAIYLVIGSFLAIIALFIIGAVKGESVITIR